MINRIYDTEIKYTRCFCDEVRFDGFTRFTDDDIKDMYAHNFTQIDHDVTEEEFLSILSSEMECRRTTGKSFLRIVTNYPVDSGLVDKLPVKPEIDNYDYWGVDTDRYKSIREKEGAKLLVADNPKVSEDGRIVDIVANYMNMTLEFAIRRIDRKFKVYSDHEKPLDMYVCYDGIEPVGNCELMVNGETAKIEDFDIIEMHQRKGFGSHVLRNLLEICNGRHVEKAYVVTDHEDTAKEMYEKCGFKILGKRTELMFRF